MEQKLFMRRKPLDFIIKSYIIKILLAEKDSLKLLGLYALYGLETVRQNSSVIYCTNDYVCKKLKIGLSSLKKYKSRLISLGLLKTIIGQDYKTKRTKYYVEVLD